MFCSSCGAENLTAGGTYCKKCGTALRDAAGTRPVIVVSEMKSPGLAAVLSFFWCGLGQIYNGEIGKGIAMLVGYFISVGLIWLVIGLITTPILWIWGMVDAYRTAERLNHQRLV